MLEGLGECYQSGRLHPSACAPRCCQRQQTLLPALIRFTSTWSASAMHPPRPSLSSSPHVCATSDGFRTRFEMLPSAQDDGDHNVVCVFEACPDPRFALVWLKKTQKDSWHWRSPRGDRGCRLLLKESGPSLVNKDVKSLRWLSFGTCSSDTSCRQKSHAYVGQPHAVRRPTARVPPNGICAPPVETLFHNHNVRRVSTPYFSQKHAHCHLGLHISLASVGRVDDSE